MKRRWIAWGLFLLSPILLHPALLRAQTTVVTSGGGSSAGVTTAALKDATYCSSATGTDAYACSLTTAPANLAAMTGVVVSFLPDVANTGPATVAFNGFAATAIVKVGLTTTTALVTGDIRAGDIVTVRYDGTSFACLSCDGNRAGLDKANTWATTQTTNGITNNTGNVTQTAGSYIGFLLGGVMQSTIALTPDSFGPYTLTTSNSMHFAEYSDVAYDFNNGACGTAACTDPSFIIHSAVQDTTQYQHFSAWGKAGGAIKALTESAATSVIRIPVASGTGTGGSLRYTIFSSDATDHQTREGEIKFAVVNKAGTETCTISAASEAADGSVVAASLGTLTYAITCDVTPANAVDIQFNAVSSLTQTTLNAYYSVSLVGPGQPARQ